LNSKNNMDKKAVLFDIDGTIMNCHSAGKTSLMEATESVFGTTGRMSTMNMQGKTDPLILFESLIDEGFGQKDIEAKIPSLKEEYFRLLDGRMKNHQCTIMPGIEKLVPLLAGRDDIILGLLTGNFERGAQIKIGRFDLNRYFALGVYGDDSHLRNEMPAIARQKIRESHNLDIDFSRMIIIGDTVYDIRCAKHAGAVSVAVGTGWVDRSVLLAENPDFYFDDLGDVELFLRVINEI